MVSEELTAELRERVALAGVQVPESRRSPTSRPLARLQEQGVVELDEERKAQMVANLLVVLCGDRAVQPVVNTGTRYG